MYYFDRKICIDRTTIIITHRLSTIQNADQIYVLDNGYVIEQGTHATLMVNEDGKYHQMIKHQQIEQIENDGGSIMETDEENEKQFCMFIFR